MLVFSKKHIGICLLFFGLPWFSADAQSPEVMLAFDKLKTITQKENFLIEADKELLKLKSFNDVKWLIEKTLLLDINSVQKKHFLVEQASYLELAGHFFEAASLWEEIARLSTSKLDVDSLLSALACHIASGNTEAAASLLTTLSFTSPAAPSLRRIAIASGWIFLAKGDAISALNRAEQLLEDKTMTITSPEYVSALLLAIYSSEGIAKDKYNKMLAALKAIPQIAFSPSPMLLGFNKADYSISELNARSAPADTSVALPGTAQTVDKNTYSDKAESSTNNYYQLGAFKDEGNAKAFASKISALGVEAVLSKKSSGGLIIVYINAGLEPNKTVMLLKDAGYEAWALSEKP